MLFPVQRPGEFITAEWELFFFHFAQFFFFFGGGGVKISSFYYKKTTKKLDFAAARLAAISATRYTGNKLFFKGGLTRNTLTYFLACTSLMLLKMTSRHRGSTPWSWGLPAIVYVLPDDVMPYANSSAAGTIRYTIR